MTQPGEAPSLFSLIGEGLKRKVFEFQDYFYLSLRSVWNAFTPPYYWADTLTQMDRIGIGSLPIILLASLSIGGVMVLNTAAQFERFGETALTGDVVALALVRELGPTVAALLIAGRNASGMASELGSMIVTEQVDAMRALGTDPLRKLMTPRVLATFFVLPLLTAVFDFIGMVGGFIVSHFTLRLDAVQFWQRAMKALDYGDLVMGMAKPAVFALIIATVGCYQGLRVRGGTEGVGRATTTAVVVSSVFVLIVDFFMTRLLLYIYR
jgi:phospholipid/cholesterol/gamma-HCH transport system permease protein